MTAMLTPVRPSATCEDLCWGVLCVVWSHSQAAAASNCSMYVCQGCPMHTAHVRDTKRGWGRVGGRRSMNNHSHSCAIKCHM